MFPPSAGFNLDVEAISGIMGSISIACWVVVFSPQIIENFRRSSAEGLSIEFVIIWLAGDFANIIGAVFQKVLPTMIILAIYYTLADIVLLGQCFYYRGFHFRDPKPVVKKRVAAASSNPENGQEEATERSALLASSSSNNNGNAHGNTIGEIDMPRTRSQSSFRERFSQSGTHLSPATPMHPTPSTPKPVSKDRTTLQSILFNLTAVIVVVFAGIGGYYLSPSAPSTTPSQDQHSQSTSLHFNLTGQIFGYLCALLYLGSRIPQLLLNYRRKSTEGISALFFLFACIGNLTFVLSIFAFNPVCGGKHGRCRQGEKGEIYARYILVNLSWLLGSLGTLFLDFGVFAQFFIYRALEDEVAVEDDDEIEAEGRGRAV